MPVRLDVHVLHAGTEAVDVGGAGARGIAERRVHAVHIPGNDARQREAAKVVQAVSAVVEGVVPLLVDPVARVEEHLDLDRVLPGRAPVVQIVVAVGTFLVLWFGGRMVLSGVITAGSLVVFIQYLSKMYKPMQELSKMTDSYSKALVGYERIQEILETEREVKDLPKAKPAPRFKGKIEFDHVNFSYSPESPILQDLSLTIEPGQVAAFVGPTGAGKTTIISLIPRFYDPTAGIIQIDGIDVRRFKQRSLRQQISFVLQETVLFHGPVWQNIAYGKAEAARTEIIRAAELANATEFIDRMPEGYNTIVGERGMTLSGGQRQRIAIARAVIRNTPILILDEPTSDLDAASEKLVHEALDRLMAGKTVITIAHRLSTIRSADVIFVIKEGKLVERGTHDQLIREGGVYAELERLQMGDEQTAERLAS